MRYRIGDPTTAVPAATHEWLVFTALLGLVIGVGLAWLGWRGRQMWLATWSGGLVVASVLYLGWAIAAG